MITKSRHTNVGLLSKRLKIQYYETSDDGMGGLTKKGWYGIGTILLDESGDPLLDESGNFLEADWDKDNPSEMWARIEPISGEELMSMEALQSNVTHRITMRFREDLQDQGYDRSTFDHELRGVYKGRVFNIEHIENRGEEDRYVRMLASEEVNDAS